jgi:hypothetical protein
MQGMSINSNIDFYSTTKISSESKSLNQNSTKNLISNPENSDFSDFVWEKERKYSIVNFFK